MTYLTDKHRVTYNCLDQTTETSTNSFQLPFLCRQLRWFLVVRMRLFRKETIHTMKWRRPRRPDSGGDHGPPRCTGLGHSSPTVLPYLVNENRCKHWVCSFSSRTYFRLGTRLLGLCLCYVTCIAMPSEIRKNVWDRRSVAGRSETVAITLA